MKGVYVRHSRRTSKWLLVSVVRSLRCARSQGVARRKIAAIMGSIDDLEELRMELTKKERDLQEQLKLSQQMTEENRLLKSKIETRELDCEYWKEVSRKGSLVPYCMDISYYEICVRLFLLLLFFGIQSNLPAKNRSSPVAQRNWSRWQTTSCRRWTKI